MTTTESMGLADLLAFLRDFNGAAIDFVDGFRNSYEATYQAAIQSGASPLEARISAIESGIRANQSFAELNE